MGSLPRCTSPQGPTSCSQDLAATRTNPKNAPQAWGLPRGRDLAPGRHSLNTSEQKARPPGPCCWALTTSSCHPHNCRSGCGCPWTAQQNHEATRPGPPAPGTPSIHWENRALGLQRQMSRQPGDWGLATRRCRWSRWSGPATRPCSAGSTDDHRPSHAAQPSASTWTHSMTTCHAASRQKQEVATDLKTVAVMKEKIKAKLASSQMCLLPEHSTNASESHARHPKLQPSRHRACSALGLS